MKIFDRNTREGSDSESSYRRGVHQAFALAGVIAGRSSTLDEARHRLGMAEDVAQSLRNADDGNVRLLDEINQRVHSGIYTTNR